MGDRTARGWLAGEPAIAPPACPVKDSWAIPDNDPLSQTPLPPAPRPANNFAADLAAEDPRTHVAGVRPNPARIPRPDSPEPHPLAVTPAPLTDLHIPGSNWSGEGSPVESNGRRAPRIGETIYGFKLVAELGRGAFARVFLAEQEALANRHVAIKITLRPTHEAERLARLQHTNVVPVYSVHDEGSMQVICMPYLGRVTIADLIRAYQADPGRHSGRKGTSARAIRSTAPDGKQKSHSKFGSDPKSGRHNASRIPTWTWGTEEPPPIIGDPIAVLQVIAQLAAGLSHAHERGILHLDLKPANVLLADTGEPMLLDFNLAFDVSAPARELVGGTMPYMAIEQLLDMRQRGKGEVDERTDIFSLGVMAFEMLTGTVLFPTTTKGLRIFDAMIEARKKGPPPIRELNPGVTPAVEAIVRKMLAPAANDRYQSAEDLREDIERHLGDEPLKYARETSVRERIGKWRRRNPRWAAQLGVALLIVSAMGLGVFAYDRAEGKARADAVEHARTTQEPLDAVRLDLVLPGDTKSRARGVQKATELLATYDLPGNANWWERPDVRRLTEAERTALAGALGELMALLAQAKWREAESQPEAERRELIAEAWKLNGAARACFTEETTPAFLNRQAALFAPAAGATFAIPGGKLKEPETARDFFLDAVSLMTVGRYKGASRLFESAITAQRDHGAAHYCLAFCRQQTGDYAASLERFDVARVMLPNDPRPSCQRGLIFGLRKHFDGAEEEYTKALAIDPKCADAYRHRALVRYKIAINEAKDRAKVEKKLWEAETDLNVALQRGAPPMFVYCVRAQTRDRRGDHAGAELDREAIRSVTLKTEEDFVASGWSRIESDPKAAAEDFQKAIALNPQSLVARQNLVHLFVNQLNDDDKALAVATQLTEKYPEFAPAFAGRAVVLARLGRRKEAHLEIERARQLANDGEIVYLAASVYALTAKTNVEDISEAVELLRESLRKGYVNLSEMATDPNLNAIRNNKEFQNISLAASTIHKTASPIPK
jgi:eukaryotic-like serine/threonine-protein kinase